MTSRRCDKTVSCHGGVLDVTLSRVTQSGDPSPRVRDPNRPRWLGSAHAYLTKCQRPESIVHEHMADREDRVPSVTLHLDDMRLRYDAYHRDMDLMTPDFSRYGLDDSEVQKKWTF